MHLHVLIQAYTPLKKITDCLTYCIRSNGEVIKYHTFISVIVIELSVVVIEFSVVVIELSVRCLQGLKQASLGQNENHQALMFNKGHHIYAIHVRFKIS